MQTKLDQEDDTETAFLRLKSYACTNKASEEAK